MILNVIICQCITTSESVGAVGGVLYNNPYTILEQPH